MISKWIWSILVLVCLSLSAWGAKKEKIPYKRQKPIKKVLIEKSMIESGIMALRLPMKNRVLAIKKMGDKGLPVLKHLAEEPSESLQTRWKAITAMGVVYPKKSAKFLHESLKSKQWFVRNAAMISMSHVNRKLALRWASKLLKDPALVVRTSAVQTIMKLNGAEYQKRLWTALYDKRNFKKGKSLWVREYIAKALSKFARNGEEMRFVKMLNDRDPRVHAWGIKGLERTTGSTLGKKSETVAKHRERWLRWWAQASSSKTM